MTFSKKSIFFGFFLILFFSLFFLSPHAFAAKDIILAEETSLKISWWIWPLSLFVFCFGLGIIAVLAGVGGGVLFVPILGTFFPFHMDFVRGAGLMVALAGSLSAGPGLLMRNLASLRLCMPMALIASISSVMGAMVGLALPQNIVRIALGLVILAICFVLLTSKRSEFPEITRRDKIAQILGIHGVYYEITQRRNINWQIQNSHIGIFLFFLVGFIAGMFGLGAGWANVAVFNLVLGAPLKISVASSNFLLSITDTSAAWIYLNNGAVLPIIAIPSVVGMMLGSQVGVRLLARTKPRIVRWLVIILLSLSGLMSILKGFSVI
ncbi:MAG TPA: sulfite exporter TauE/SafE family protein [Thermodesulfobium narugense]|nr:MAG: hypothetical protein C0174_05960 [Thermodesulfobium narugense]HEM55916.1 sulfite exporter TauE/SafE family protein [Thermodesulfobium narugense]